MQSSEGAWTPLRAEATGRWGVARRVGPYRLGPRVRESHLGVVFLAAHSDHERVLELEHYTTLRETVNDDPDGRLMLDLALASTLEHRHVAKIVGVGLLDDAPYVVRPHHPGRVLEQVLDRGPLDQASAIGVLYSVAEALGFLADEGPQPGSCAMGGLDACDVALGFEGSVHLTGTGLARARAARRALPPDDATALFGLAEQIMDPDALPEPGLAPALWARALSRRYPEQCGRRAYNIAGALRRRFAERIIEERRNLGLPPIH